jgi:hypothetical protein
MDNIEHILEKYWAGETSIEEERHLKAYFAKGNVDERFRYAIPFFQTLREERAVQMTALVTPMRASSSWRRWAAAAALVGAMAIAGWHAIGEHRTQIAAQAKLNTDTYEDPEKAAAEIKAALALVSSKINKGKKQMKKGLQKIDKADKFIPKPGK